MDNGEISNLFIRKRGIKNKPYSESKKIKYFE